MRMPERWPWAWLFTAALLILCVTQFVVIAVRSDDHLVVVILYSFLIAAMTVPIAWARRAPIRTAVVVLGVLVLAAAQMPHFNSVTSLEIVGLVPPYAVGSYCNRRTAIIGLGLCLAGFALIDLADPTGATWVSDLSSCFVAWCAGVAVGALRGILARLREATDRVRAEAETRERLAVAGERARLAREIQAAVARRVSAIVVQSEAAQRLLDDDVDAAVRTIMAIEQTGREALEDMRRVVGLLRHDGLPAVSPAPDVSQVVPLVDQARQAGLDVELHIHGELMPLPATVGLGTYRILADVLVALTHSPAASAVVTIRFGQHDTELTIDAHGDPVTWPVDTIREHAAMCTGTYVIHAENGKDRLRVSLPNSVEAVQA
jgi:signal transduction histidine kinase